MNQDFLDEDTVTVARPDQAQDDRLQEAVQILEEAPALRHQIPFMSDLRQFSHFNNPILNASAELLALCVCLRKMSEPTNLFRFKQGLVRDIGEVKRLVSELDYPPSVADKVAFLFCIALDEFILHTDWGEQIGWENQTLLSELFGVRNGGEQFFAVMDKALRQPKMLLDLLELMYILIRIGFVGQFRSSGEAELDKRVRQLEQLMAKMRTPAKWQIRPSVELPKNVRPQKSIKYGLQLSLFVVCVGLVFGVTRYGYQRTFEQRASDFTQLQAFTESFFSAANEQDFVYLSTDEEMTIAQGVYGQLPKLNSSARNTTTMAINTHSNTNTNSNSQLRWGVQLGTFETEAMGSAFIREHGLQDSGAVVDRWHHLYRVIAKEETSAAARALLATVVQQGISDAFIVRVSQK